MIVRRSGVGAPRASASTAHALWIPTITADLGNRSADLGEANRKSICPPTQILHRGGRAAIGNDLEPVPVWL